MILLQDKLLPTKIINFCDDLRQFFGNFLLSHIVNNYKLKIIKVIYALYCLIYSNHIYNRTKYFQKIGKNIMAFVYSSPRWIPPKIQQTPGPGSHSPELISSPISKQVGKNKIRKGKVFGIGGSGDENKENKQGQSRQNKQIIKLEKNKVAVQEGKNIQAIKLNWQSLSTSSFKPINVQNGKFMEIKSINPKKQAEESKIQFDKSLKHQPQLLLEQKQMNFLEFLNDKSSMKKANASIKQCYTENFYIGSKDLQQKQKRKCTKSPLQALKHNRIYNENKNISVKDDSQLLKSPEIQLQIMQKKKKRQKSMTANHPFRKRQQQISQSIQQSALQLQKYQQKSTGIQEQEASEFIQNAIPGPGSYDLNFTQSTKKSMMFTENRDRFEDHLGKNKVAYEFYYSQIPKPRKTLSRAKQSRVGFGRSIQKYGKPQNSPKDQSQNEKQNQMTGVDLCYQDYQTIENKCLKMKVKDTLNPGFFISKAPRFKNSNTNLSKIMKFDKYQLEKEQKLSKMKTTFSNKLSYPFKSQTRKEKQDISLTTNIDFTGQKYKTIEQKVQQIIQQSKYKIIQESQAQKAHQIATHSNNDRISIETDKQLKTQVEIKHHLVETIYGFRQRQNKKIDKDQIKGYTFGQSNGPNCNTSNTPSPTHYNTGKQWITPTHNLKFVTNKSKDQSSKEKKKIQTQGQEKIFGCILKVKEIKN